MIQVCKIQDQESLEKAFGIRNQVFVIEQEVDRNEEYDEFESSSTHYLALADEKPVGTCRWRITKNGVKMERFAVLKEFRNTGVGAKLLTAALNDVPKNQYIYLHAQVQAMDFYSKHGFFPEGPMFEECNIQHYKMAFKTGL